VHFVHLQPRDLGGCAPAGGSKRPRESSTDQQPAWKLLDSKPWLERQSSDTVFSDALDDPVAVPDAAGDAAARPDPDTADSAFLEVPAGGKEQLLVPGGGIAAAGDAKAEGVEGPPGDAAAGPEEPAAPAAAAADGQPANSQKAVDAIACDVNDGDVSAFAGGECPGMYNMQQLQPGCSLQERLCWQQMQAQQYHKSKLLHTILILLAEVTAYLCI
jgi:hypothetical protein